MVRHLITTWFGSFVYDGEVVSKRLFPKDAEGIAKRMALVRQGKTLKEERELAKGLEAFMVHENRLEELGGTRSREAAPEIACQDFGYPLSLLQKVHLSLARESLRAPRKPDKEITELLKFRDGLLEAREGLGGRLADWAEELYPGLTEARGWREALVEGSPEKLASSCGLDSSVFRMPYGSEGKAASEAASRLLELDAAIRSLEEVVSGLMRERCLNLARLAGPILGARLLTLAGGLERLALTSSSRVQMLGAEKALFRYRKRGGKPPKHGVLLQHPAVHSRPKRERGRAARVLAGKIVIAARADAFTHRDLGSLLTDDLERRLSI